MKESAIPPRVRQDFWAALLDAFPKQSSLERFADLHLDINMQRLGGDNLEDMVYELMREAARTGRLRTLAAEATAAVPDNRLLSAAVKNVLDALAQADEVAWYRRPEDPFETCFVVGQKPFFGRGGLRVGLKKLQSREAAGLVVTGNPKTGKSYSWRLVQYICEEYEGNQIAYVDLGERGATFGAGALTDMLMRRFGRSSRTSEKPPRESQDTRWARNLAEFLAEELSATGQTWWLVFDGVDSEVVAKDTLDLVKQLLLVADSFMYPMHVVLLDCREPLPPEVEPYVEKEDLPPLEAAVVRRVLRGFFSDFVRHRGQAVEEGAIDRTVSEVLDLVAEGPDDLGRLGAAVRRVAERLPA